MLAGSTGLEPAASGVTGRRSNQLNYDPKKERTDDRQTQSAFAKATADRLQKRLLIALGLPDEA
jgi:hypothetical protein